MNGIIKVGALMLAGFALGFGWRDLRNGQLPSARSVSSLIGVKLSDPGSSPERLFRENYQRILTSYVRPVDGTDLKYAGIQGMMASLGDPHTVFLEPKAAKRFSDDTRANFFGVGAALDPDPMGARIQTVFEEGPAFAAGLRDGDLIIGVNGKSVASMPLDKIVEQIKGPEGTVVKLTIIPSGQTRQKVLTIRRARIVTPTVRSRNLPGGVGYLSISSFAEPTAMQFDRELDKLEAKGINGLVIDLRGNPGGLLETATEMLSRFVENKPVVTMKMRGEQEITERTFSRMRRDFGYPITVLINEDSASAAEIFAGCLRDYGKATLVGEHSYGKASVQNLFPLVDNASAKITIAKYYLPMGEFIGRKVDAYGGYLSGGLKPDVEVDLNLDLDPRFGDPKSDSQLMRAIEVLKAKR